LDVAPIEIRLAFRRPTGADEANCVLITLRVNDKNEPLLDRSDGDEPVLFIGMGIVEDFQVVVSTMEQGTGFLKGNAVLLPIRAALGSIPDDPHSPSIVQGLTKSMT
jgi:hypothetical protein